MLINLFFNRKSFFEYEVGFIKQLFIEIPHVEIRVVILSDLSEDFLVQKKTNAFIDSKFSNFRKSALQIVPFEEFVTLFPQIKFGDKEIITPDFSLFFHQVKTPGFYTVSEKNFSFQHSKNEIRNRVFSTSKYLTIRIIKFDLSSKTWLTFLNLEISKENGYYNSTNKYYYYSAILMLKALRMATYAVHQGNQTINYPKIKSTPKLIYYGMLLKKLILRKFKKQHLNWKIAVKKNEDFLILNPKKGSFYADPFFITKEDRNYIFFEEFNYERNLGEIAVLEVDQQFKTKHKSTILKENFHYSFPNVFDFDGDFYMLPETAQNGELSIYKSKAFPLQWEKFFTLMKNIKLLDAVWVKHNDRYYIFASKIHDFEYDNNECLYIYYSNNLFSKEWYSHSLNPVVTNLNSARNAGKIFTENTRIFRPSQNCEKSYGKEVTIQEIIELSPTTYKENAVKKLVPPKGFVGLHTYNKIDKNTVLVDFLKEE